MLNYIWLGMILLSIVFGMINGKIDAVVTSVTEEAKHAFEMALLLGGILSFWLGIMRIAEHSGLIERIALTLRPILKRLFPDVPEDHPAMGAIVMNIAANMLGLANAATPFGLKAMEALDDLNIYKGQASNAMCMLLAINTSSVQLIPASAIGFLAAANGVHPTNIILTSLFATTLSTIAAITACKVFERWSVFKIQKDEEISTC
ncbi:MAG TPA: nucleoside recognition domain-containing protein [Gammaproteobacteria bacterium]|nr:nucleoside recognition domain-containing protein [Gammaproteobacteria bacterium]